MRRTRRRWTLLMRLLVLAPAVAACQPGGPFASGDASTPGAATASPPAAILASPVERATLPAGFPVLPGARLEALTDDDRAVIARWTSDEVGPVAYDFYVEALPAAGYPIAGLYPGGAVAVIRFDVPAGAIWQLVLTRDGAVTRIEVRRDQP